MCGEAGAAGGSPSGVGSLSDLGKTVDGEGPLILGRRRLEIVSGKEVTVWAAKPARWDVCWKTGAAGGSSSGVGSLSDLGPQSRPTVTHGAVSEAFPAEGSRGVVKCGFRSCMKMKGGIGV